MRKIRVIIFFCFCLIFFSFPPVGEAQTTRVGLSHTIPPVYPREAKEKGWEGTVLIRAYVDEKGKVERVQIKKSSGQDILDWAAYDAVWKWNFIPAKENGTPTSSIVDIPINFDLRSERIKENSNTKGQVVFKNLDQETQNISEQDPKNRNVIVLDAPVQYPGIAKANGLEGTVLLRIVVNQGGNAESVRVVQSSGHAVLDRAASGSIWKWVFRPSEKNGITQKSTIEIPLIFKLDSSLPILAKKTYHPVSEQKSALGEKTYAKVKRDSNLVTKKTPPKRKLNEKLASLVVPEAKPKCKKGGSKLSSDGKPIQYLQYSNAEKVRLQLDLNLVDFGVLIQPRDSQGLVLSVTNIVQKNGIWNRAPRLRQVRDLISQNGMPAVMVLILDNIPNSSANGLFVPRNVLSEDNGEVRVLYYENNKVECVDPKIGFIPKKYVPVESKGFVGRPDALKGTFESSKNLSGSFSDETPFGVAYKGEDDISMVSFINQKTLNSILEIFPQHNTKGLLQNK
ncbi:energy transducer TonB [Candidatus Nitronereus thalassa]|uniref:Energy transducer TonB n=1 Tax=Candidatus Nitronereus thalassa TaxID=3020898 RepID=A0ABU3KDM2_9BACT|nr:energy transducer TonB [Candidatus Nitronereus thalassa]MDT7044297.1 energy transducer TonB [Candidatus Nitronereus thalassa]